MKSPFLDKSALSLGNKSIHMRRKSNEEHLGDDLANAMDKANGTKVGDVLRPILLGQESNVRKVKPMKIGDMEVHVV
jgi:hypothetical protein